MPTVAKAIGEPTLVIRHSSGRGVHWRRWSRRRPFLVPSLRATGRDQASARRPPGRRAEAATSGGRPGPAVTILLRDVCRSRLRRPPGQADGSGDVRSARGRSTTPPRSTRVGGVSEPV